LGDKKVVGVFVRFSLRRFNWIVDELEINNINSLEGQYRGFVFNFATMVR
jgi:hypothetical protein